MNQRIVCAAIRFGDFVICGARHYDHFMHDVMNRTHPINISDTRGEQGFIDNKGNFHDRKTAFIIAEANGQIIKKSGNPASKELFSEDLY